MVDSIKGLGIGNPLDGAMAGYSSLGGSEKSVENALGRIKGGKELDLSSSNEAESDKKSQKAATQFEALLLHQMLNSMWQTIPKNGLLSGSREESLYRDMLNQAVADSISTGKSIGIKNVVMKELKNTEKK